MIFSIFGMLAMLLHGPAAFSARESAPSPVSVSVTLGAEAWYDESEICPAAGICTPSTFLTTAADTLSVASQAGTESARTYLQIPADALPAGAVISGGLLRMQLDTSSTDGSVQPDMGLLKACTTTASFVAGTGLTTTPPVADCSVSAPSDNIGSPASEVDFDLAPLAAKLSQPGTSLVIESAVVSITADPTNATFHDVFPASTNATLAGQAPVLSLTYAAPATAATDPVDPTAPTPTETGSGSPSEAATVPVPAGHSAGQPVTAAAPVTGGTTTAAAPVTASGAQPTTVVPAAPVAAAPVSGTAVAIPAPVVVGAAAAAEPSPAGIGTVTLGGGPKTELAALGTKAAARYYDYPEVFFLPLLLGFGIFAMGRQLTRPLTAEKEQDDS